jgi:hypothetical protein
MKKLSTTSGLKKAGPSPNHKRRTVATMRNSSDRLPEKHIKPRGCRPAAPLAFF